MTEFLKVRPGSKSILVNNDNQPEQIHVFDRDSIDAVNAALAARRPLLIRGEPGTGKSQLARAAAKRLKRAYVPFVVDARTESRELLWDFDAVARLAEAQLAGVHGKDYADKLPNPLDLVNFIRPGPLWWAFDWEGAAQQAQRSKTPLLSQPDGGDPKNGVVVLIDEIDKAESDVPNGLLGALGSAEFTPQGFSKAVTITGAPPLVIITSNEERALPDAFVRRCLVLCIELPNTTAELAKYLEQRGKAHFPKADKTVLKEAARQVAADRKVAIAENLRPFPGQAEYLDLVRTVLVLYRDSPDQQKEALQRIGNFSLRKHRGTGPL